MKKNFAMRVAACLLVVTMLSLCMVSYTYAKYTTGAYTDEKVAQVAKWGVEVKASLADIFETGYVNGPLEELDDDTATVLTSGTYNLFAPGTKDEQAAALTITGTPEVAVTVDYTLTVELDKWEVTSGEYMPLVFVIKVTTTNLGTTAEKTFKIGTGSNEYATVALLQQAMIDFVDSYDIIAGAATERVNPNVDLNTQIDISWSWAYHVDDATDKLDTELGDNADDGNPATCTISLGATVTQID